jgi:alkylation response protein AidB-like acyl-CoA dehydrogenase
VGAAFYDTMRILDRGRISIAAMALGLGRGALELAMRYATERESFGKPIAQHQAIRFMIANARTQLDASELMIQRAAWLCDQNRPYSLEASTAKLLSSEVATRVCNDALQIHGGYGYTREFEVERFLRDVKLCEIGEGTSEIQRVVIARYVLGP